MCTFYNLLYMLPNCPPERSYQFSFRAVYENTHCQYCILFFFDPWQLLFQFAFLWLLLRLNFFFTRNRSHFCFSFCKLAVNVIGTYSCWSLSYWFISVLYKVRISTLCHSCYKYPLMFQVTFNFVFLCYLIILKILIFNIVKFKKTVFSHF